MAAEPAPALAELELPVAQRAQELELRPEAQLEPSPVEPELSRAGAALELRPLAVELQPRPVAAGLELRPVVVKLQLSPAEAVVIR